VHEQDYILELVTRMKRTIVVSTPATATATATSQGEGAVQIFADIWAQVNGPPIQVSCIIYNSCCSFFLNIL
jgi:hypothetical protein